VRRDYRLHLMVGFVLALALLWSLTFIDYRAGDDYVVQLSEQEVVEMEEVKQTAQEVAPPPPPRPTAPIEVANDAIIDDTRELNFDATLDLNAALDVGPAPSAPPPPEPEAVEEDEIFVVVEEQPVLMGGLKALQAQIQYPEMAAKAGIDGRVIVQFIVDETGRVTDAVVMRGRHRLLDQEALRVVQDARFTPGRQRGEPVKVQMALPITFVLQER
jgi:protein TonB